MCEPCVVDRGPNAWRPPSTGAEARRGARVALLNLAPCESPTAADIVEHLLTILGPRCAPAGAAARGVSSAGGQQRLHVRGVAERERWRGGASPGAIHLLATGADAVGRIPALRWDYPPEPTAGHYGCFLPGADCFDRRFFSLSMAEANGTDPQQRLLLEEGYTALHAARHARRSLVGADIGIFLGIMNADYAAQYIRIESVYAATGGTISIAAGRLSFALGVQGPCVSYDTACSAALVATHAGAEAAKCGECVASLAVAVSLMLSPLTHSMYALAGMLSVDGRCKTFDARANGYTRGEGVGAIVLAPAAEEAAPREVAMHGSRVRSDGRSASITAPNGKAQVQLHAECLRAADATRLCLAECHGTGTALGDPIEARAFANAAVAAASGGATVQPYMGSAKANVGHTEPCAGMVGLLRLATQLERTPVAVNAQLRLLNPLLQGSVGSVRACLVTQGGRTKGSAAGVSSFGYSGTISHAIFVAGARGEELAAPSAGQPVERFRRCAFPWRERTSPLLQTRLEAEPEASEEVVFRSPAAGGLCALVADHVVQGRIIFPGAAHLELARAASRAAAGADTALPDVMFISALYVEAAGLVVECAVGGGSATVRSGDGADGDGVLAAPTTHCTGSVAVAPARLAASAGDRRQMRCFALERAPLYQRFHDDGLMYGPEYRDVHQAWSGADGLGVALLRHDQDRRGTCVHPAVLDGAIQLSVLTWKRDASDDGGTRLPFAVTYAQLQGAAGKQWAAVEPFGAEAVSVRLGVPGGAVAAQLTGLKARVLKAAKPVAAVAEHLYATQWRSARLPAEPEGTPTAPPSRRPMLVLMPTALDPSPGRALAPLPAQPRDGQIVTMVTASATRAAAQPLASLHGLFVVANAAACAASVPTVWVLTSAPHARAPHTPLAAQWGFARAARAEAQLPLHCIDSPSVGHGIEERAWLTEPETVLRGGGRAPLVPRLATSENPADGLVRLHFHARGAVTNLYFEQLPTLSPSAEEVVVAVRAVGLNFRDVLNVLGEYPGDPGPPGGDNAGVLVDDPSGFFGDQSTLFGIGVAPLAHRARALALMMAPKPAALSFAGVSTLPITWSTTHMACRRLSLHAARACLVHAGAGGVGLKALEYGQWLGAPIGSTAGGRNKHQQLRSVGVTWLSSSRDPAAFAAATASASAAGRHPHGVLNSLSADFIAVSFALLREGGSFQEIGKRAIWSAPRHAHAAPATTYGAIALDADFATSPAWMHTVLSLVSSRADQGAVAALPLASFDLRDQYEQAFRYLLGGYNVGKVVIRVAVHRPTPAECHAVTGGTSGIGLLTGQWLLGKGARGVALAARSGRLAAPAAQGWAALGAQHGAEVRVERCDTGEVSQGMQLALCFGATPLGGLWHAAGTLYDDLLTRINARAMAGVYAPKAHGAWLLDAATKPAALQACVMFSSVTALLGSAGQANYCAANACLDALSYARQGRGLVATSVQWGAWAEIGMASRGAAESRWAALEKSTGMGRVRPEQGMTALHAALTRTGPAVHLMVPITWRPFMKGKADVAFLAAFKKHASAAGSGGGSGGSNGAGAKGDGLTLPAVIELVERTAGGGVDADTPFMEAGIDSLGAVELRNTLNAASGGKMHLPSTLIFDHPTARSIASLLAPPETAGDAAPGEGGASAADGAAGRAVRAGLSDLKCSVELGGARWSSVELGGARPQVLGGGSVRSLPWVRRGRARHGERRGERHRPGAPLALGRAERPPGADCRAHQARRLRAWGGADRLRRLLPLDGRGELDGPAPAAAARARVRGAARRLPQSGGAQP